MKKIRSTKAEKIILSQIDDVLKVLPQDYYKALNYMLETHQGFRLLITIANNDYQQKKQSYFQLRK
ncbi:hypothetical protein ACWG0P_14135 [Amedibacillus sp. YH-ame6]